MRYRQLAASGCATAPQSLGSVESELSVADVSSLVGVVVSVELVVGVTTEFAELSLVPAVAVAVTGVAAVLCAVSSARASPGRASAKAAARATMAGTIQPWIRFRCSEVMAFRSVVEGSTRDLHTRSRSIYQPCRQPLAKLEP
jgi:hypothetical protein